MHYGIQENSSGMKINTKGKNILMLLHLFAPRMSTCKYMHMFILCIRMEILTLNYVDFE